MKKKRNAIIVISSAIVLAVIVFLIIKSNNSTTVEKEADYLAETVISTSENDDDNKMNKSPNMEQSPKSDKEVDVNETENSENENKEHVLEYSTGQYNKIEYTVDSENKIDILSSTGYELRDVTPKDVLEKLHIQLFDGGGWSYIFDNGTFQRIYGSFGKLDLNNEDYAIIDLDKDGNLDLVFCYYVYAWTNYKCISCYSNSKVANGYIGKNLNYEITKIGENQLSILLDENKSANLKLLKENDTYQLKIDLSENLYSNFEISKIEPLEIIGLPDFNNVAKTYADISLLSVGMNVADVFEILGVPNDYVGSGIVRALYTFEDGRKMIISYYGAGLAEVRLVGEDGESEIVLGEE